MWPTKMKRIQWPKLWKFSSLSDSPPWVCFEIASAMKQFVPEVIDFGCFELQFSSFCWAIFFGKWTCQGTPDKNLSFQGLWCNKWWPTTPTFELLWRRKCKKMLIECSLKFQQPINWPSNLGWIKHYRHRIWPMGCFLGAAPVHPFIPPGRAAGSELLFSDALSESLRTFYIMWSRENWEQDLPFGNPRSQWNIVWK